MGFAQVLDYVPFESFYRVIRGYMGFGVSQKVGVPFWGPLKGLQIFEGGVSLGVPRKITRIALKKKGDPKHST